MFFSEGASAQEQHEFLSEIEFMKKVGFHKNIISMVACCTKENQAFLIVEFIQHGDLLQLLKDKRQKVSLVINLYPNSNDSFRFIVQNNFKFSNFKTIRYKRYKRLQLTEVMKCYSWPRHNDQTLNTE